MTCRKVAKIVQNPVSPPAAPMLTSPPHPLTVQSGQQDSAVNKRKSQLARSPTDALVRPVVHVWVSWAASCSLTTRVRLCLWGRNPADWLASCPSLSASRATELVATVSPRGPVSLCGRGTPGGGNTGTTDGATLATTPWRPSGPLPAAGGCGQLSARDLCS